MKRRPPEPPFYRRHHLTAKEFVAMGDRCHACGTTEPGGRWGTFTIDHDHSCCPGMRSCGRCVRGLLCAACNLALGHLKDDPRRVQALLDYLIHPDHGPWPRRPDSDVSPGRWAS